MTHENPTEDEPTNKRDEATKALSDDDVQQPILFENVQLPQIENIQSPQIENVQSTQFENVQQLAEVEDVQQQHQIEHVDQQPLQFYNVVEQQVPIDDDV